MGRGVYGLSAAGRSRFQEFPDLVADDHFVHHLFSAAERVVVEQATSVVQGPRRLRDLLHRKTRSDSGLVVRTLWDGRRNGVAITAHVVVRRNDLVPFEGPPEPRDARRFCPRPHLGYPTAAGTSPRSHANRTPSEQRAARPDRSPPTRQGYRWIGEPGDRQP